MLDEFRAISVCADAETCLTSSSYITNPERVASRTFAYPKQPSKKGLQVDPRRLGEARELGVNHSVVNVLLDKLAGDQVDLLVNGQCVARGDVVVIDDNFGIRITEILEKPDINELAKYS